MGQLRAAIADDTCTQSRFARLSRLLHMLEGGTDAVGTSGVHSCENGSGSKIALDGQFFDHKMCRIFGNIRKIETGVLGRDFSYMWLSPGTKLVVRIPVL